MTFQKFSEFSDQPCAIFKEHPFGTNEHSIFVGNALSRLQFFEL